MSILRKYLPGISHVSIYLFLLSYVTKPQKGPCRHVEIRGLGAILVPPFQGVQIFLVPPVVLQNVHRVPTYKTGLHTSVFYLNELCFPLGA